MQDVASTSWCRLADLYMSRENCGVVESDRHIFVVGGRCDGDSKSGTFEIFDPETNRWTIYEDKILKSDEEYISIIFN